MLLDKNILYKISAVFFLIPALYMHPVNAQVEYSFNAPAVEKKDSIEKKAHLSYGVTGSLAAVISTGNDIPNGVTHFRIGHSIGLYFLAPLSPKIYFYLGVLSSQRGFNIKYSSHTQTTKVDRITSVDGYEKLYYLDKFKCLGYNFTKRFSVYGGMMTSFRLKTKTKYDVTTNTTSFATGATTVNSYQYNKIGNAAIDLIDFAYVIGVRARIGKFAGLSLRYTRDFAAFNISSASAFKNAYINSGFYFSLDIALSQKMVEVW
jgi:hypothetical protein